MKRFPEGVPRFLSLNSNEHNGMQKGHMMHF